jgi:hypothetical protein
VSLVLKAIRLNRLRVSKSGRSYCASSERQKRRAIGRRERGRAGRAAQEGCEMTDPTPERPEPIDSARLREEVRKKGRRMDCSSARAASTRAEAIERLLAEALPREAAARAIPAHDLNASNDQALGDLVASGFEGFDRGDAIRGRSGCIRRQNRRPGLSQRLCRAGIGLFRDRRLDGLQRLGVPRLR